MLFLFFPFNVADQITFANLTLDRKHKIRAVDPTLKNPELRCGQTRIKPSNDKPIYVS